jgi:hypothetical protein
MQESIEAPLEHGAAIFCADANDNEIGGSRRLEIIFVEQSSCLRELPKPQAKPTVPTIYDETKFRSLIFAELLPGF